MKALMDLTARERRHLMLRLTWAAVDLLEVKRASRIRTPSNSMRRLGLPIDLDIDIDSQIRHPLK